MIDWIALNMTPGIGPRAAAKLLEAFGSPESVFHARRDQLEKVKLRPDSVESIINKYTHDAAEEELEKVKRLGGDVLILDDGTYPAMLREIADPPITLYVLGDWRTCFEMPTVAMIGSRLCSTYGLNAAEMLSRDLATNGICVVSGLARGIDTAAHRATVKAGGRTIGVMGTGIDAIYPKENVKLVEEMIESGSVVVSQFPLGTPPLNENFPYRNRIISGLSHGVVLVEATERSGSLITARLATEQGREVMAVPGNITSKNSFGTNYLIKAGAKLVQQWQDIVNELPQHIGAQILPPKPENSSGKRVATSTEAVLPADLTANERKVWKHLLPDKPIHIDDLIDATALSFGDLNSALVGLDLRDMIRVLPGKNYARRI